ncbi:MAG: nuclear transport factor 2 family protein [Parvibaculaceae bacterium]
MEQPSQILATLAALAAAFNAHDIDRIMSFFAEDCSLDMPRGPEPHGQRFEGKQAVREGLLGRLRGIPDVHYGDLEHQASGNSGTSKWLLTGTRIDGTPVRVHGCDFYSFENGLVTRKDSYWKIVE